MVCASSRRLIVSGQRRPGSKTVCAIQAQILQSVQPPAPHPGIQKIQNIFGENSNRLYHRTRHPGIPAENNPADRELRPGVMARKISFGSQSERGLQTREVLLRLLHTLSKRSEN